MLEARIEAAKFALKKAQARLERLEAKAREPKKQYLCRGCGKELQIVGQGRPRVWCDGCRDGEQFKQWFRDKYRDKWRQYQQNYRKAKKARIIEMDSNNN